MAIDPMMYKKYNKRDIDIGATLAQADARQAQRDKAPKGVAGGISEGMWYSRMPLLLVIVRWLSVFGSKKTPR